MMPLSRKVGKIPFPTVGVRGTTLSIQTAQLPLPLTHPLSPHRQVYSPTLTDFFGIVGIYLLCRVGIFIGLGGGVRAFIGSFRDFYKLVFARIYFGGGKGGKMVIYIHKKFRRRRFYALEIIML